MNTKIRIIALLFVQLAMSTHLSAATVSVYGLEAMPYCGVIDGRPVGIAIDVLTQATKYGAPDFKFIFDVPWIRATLRVEEASGDELVAIIPFTRSNVREKRFKWVAEIMATEYRFYTNDKNLSIQSVDVMKNETIGVVHGHAIIPMLEKMGLQLDSGARSAQKNAMKMVNKRFRIMADSDVIALYSWKKIGQDIKELRVGPAIGEIKHVYIATGLSFPDEVAKSISDAVEKMKNNGELQKIYDKWLSDL